MRETLQWLDDITSRFPNIVTLQGADETYERWEEVEKFVVPRTLFSENDCAEDAATEADSTITAEQGLSKLALDDARPKTATSSVATDATRSLSPSSFRSQRSSVSVPSPPTSPMKEVATPTISEVAQNDQKTPVSSDSVPTPLQPLFNYILWRIHQEVDPVAALESFIFLCNDQRKVNFAKGFEIKTKRLEQLREAINREDRDFKNRMALTNRDGQNGAAPTSPKKVEDDDDDEVVYKPPPRAPAAMLPKQNQPPNPSNVMDPDDFGRKSHIPAKQQIPSKQQFSPVQATRGAFPNQFGSRGMQRGNFRGNARGRGGNFVSSSPRSNPRLDATGTDGQIDPNSFARPRGNGHAGRGARKLWVPT